MNEIKINGHHYRSLSKNSDMALAQPGDLVMTVGDTFIYKVSSITEKVASLDPWHGEGHRHEVHTVLRTNASLVRVEKFDPPQPVVETVYLNWYGGDGFISATREGADRAGAARKACIAITSTDGVVTGVSLAPWATYAPPKPPPWPSASKPT